MKVSPKESLWLRISAGSTDENQPSTPESGLELPWPGTLWAHPATAVFAVEWLVVDHAPHRAREYLLMAADSEPVLGMTDVAVPYGEPSGPLSIRCHSGRWVSPALLRHARISGRISGGRLDCVRHRYQEVLGRPAPDLLLAADGGPSAIYEDRVAEIDRAWIALTGALGADPGGGSECRGPRRQMLLTHEAEHVLICVPLEPECLFPRYRMTLHDLNRNRVTWRAQGLQACDDGCRVALSTTLARKTLLPRTLYRVQVDGYSAPSWVTVCRRMLEVREPADGFFDAEGR